MFNWAAVAVAVNKLRDRTEKSRLKAVIIASVDFVVQRCMLYSQFISLRLYSFTVDLTRQLDNVNAHSREIWWVLPKVSFNLKSKWASYLSYTHKEMNKQRAYKKNLLINISTHATPCALINNRFLLLSCSPHTRAL